MKCDVGFWECLPHLLRICRILSSRGEARCLASRIVFRGGRKTSKRNATAAVSTKTPRRTAAGRLETANRYQCFFVDDVEVVAVVPEVVVAVVPVVDVAVVEVMAVPEVSLIVPAGMAEVDVEPVVSLLVAIVPVVLAVSVAIVDAVSVAAALVSVLLLLVSLLQAKPKTLSARTVTRTRSFLLIMFFPLDCVLLFGKLGWLKKSACSPPLAID